VVRRCVQSLLVAIALFAAGCGGDGPVQREESALLAIVEPLLDRLEPDVRQQLATSRAHVRSLREGGASDPVALGTAYAELGRRYHAYEFFEAALPCYLNAETLLSDASRWPYYLGRVYASLGRWDEAEAAFERSLALLADDVPARVELGRTHLARAEFTEAETAGRRALETEPASAGALLLLAETAAERGDSPAAVGWYEALIELQPGATRIYKPLALAYRGAGRLDDARGALARAGEGHVRLRDPLMQALRSRAAGALPYRQAGIAAFQRGDFEVAETQFRQAIEADPDYEGDRLNLGAALTELGRLDEAGDQVREVIAINPRHGLAHYNLGVILDALGRRIEALESYREALRIEAGSYKPRFNLATALREEGRCTEALEHYARILREFPGDRSARVGETLCLIDEGQFPEARERLEEALRTSPGNAWLANVTSRLLAASPQAAMRDGTRALALARPLVAARRSPEHLETLAMALAELGRFEEAIAAQNEAIAAAEAQGRRGLLPRFRENLVRYEGATAARDPLLE